MKKRMIACLIMLFLAGPAIAKGGAKVKAIKIKEIKWDIQKKDR